MDTEQLLTVAQAPSSVQQQYGAPQQLSTNYFLLAAEQQPATMQQVVQPPQAPIVPSAPIQDVNQVAPQYSAPQYQAPQYRGGNHCAQQIVTVSIHCKNRVVTVTTKCGDGHYLSESLHGGDLCMW